ncbi:Nitrogen permease regulator 2 [Steccherinum ochraceum]|uniref:Nitrogen permease regulator 2 n=1 Tax=Steccherinum ochraceum TaxID=92696 RepID=A0A4R0RBU1_9APHY|nr:Nitrogen permease regulator 2 [Steccherinum ochraceum]
MTSEGASFLPRIESVFYAVFDVLQGPKIVYQVPEGLISGSGSSISAATSLPGSALLSPSPGAIPAKADSEPTSSRASSSALLSSPSIQRIDLQRHLHSPQKRSESTNKWLFNFDDVSKYIIPPSALCGRLVRCATGKYRIIGFPVELRGKYERNYFRYNLCFVFARAADLSCYEPVVRKVTRVLTNCEEESAFLSRPPDPQAMYAILEQLYEDLNSYSETSIPIDKFNSIELKIFPFYPNPPQVKDWMVPLALINLTRRVESNWDLTMVKVCKYIDGTNHVSRIAALAEVDIDFAREAISHLLYYQVVMMIDIFQYSNMYTLRKNTQTLADEPHVSEECGPYVTKPGHKVSDWPVLLHLYSRMKPGKTIIEWMQEYDVLSIGVDVRRFTSFGVVKGFLRRVHRWPVLLSPPNPQPIPPVEVTPVMPTGRQRGKSTSQQSVQTVRVETEQTRIRGRVQEPMPTMTSAGAELVAVKPTTETAYRPVRRSSAAESSLEQLQNRSIQETNGFATTSRITRPFRTGSVSTMGPPTRRAPLDNIGYAGMPTPLPALSASPQFPTLRMSPDMGAGTDGMESEHSSGGRSTLGVTRPRFPRSPSAPVGQLQQHTAAVYPPDLLTMLDGEHNTDEICARFSVSWSQLERWLANVGGEQYVEGGGYGNVAIIYR